MSDQNGDERDRTAKGPENQWPTLRSEDDGRLFLRVSVPEGVDAVTVGEILTRHGVPFSAVEDLSGEPDSVQVELIGGEDAADRAETALRDDLAGG